MVVYQIPIKLVSGKLKTSNLLTDAEILELETLLKE
jgi:hypothetical protein